MATDMEKNRKSRPIEKTFWLTDDLRVLTSGKADGFITHVFCRRGTLRFQMHQQDFEVNSLAYAILIEPKLVEQFQPSTDFKATLLLLSRDLPSSGLADDGFNVIAMPFLLLDPIIPLTDDDRQLLAEDLLLLERRMLLKHHHVYNEMVNTIFELHVFNLHDMIMRRLERSHITERSERLMSDFVNLLRQGHYREHRDLYYYASRLYVADNYLTQLSRKVSHHPATYWINLFTISEIARLIKDGQLSLSEIADRFHFSSMSYFTRYVQRLLGHSPSELRK